MHALLILLIILLIGLIAWEERHRASVASASQAESANTFNVPFYHCRSEEPRPAEPDYSPLADPVIPERWRPVDIPINWAVDSGDRLSAEGPVPQAANIRVNFEPDHDVLED